MAPTTRITLGKGLNMGLLRAMEQDSKVLVMGGAVGLLGGVCRITDCLQKGARAGRVTDHPRAGAGLPARADGRRQWAGPGDGVGCCL